MIVNLHELEEWLRKPEGEHLEFKAARENFHFDKLLRYCAALANEGGGKMILGVTDKRPRKVVGTNAFPEPERTVGSLVERLRLKAEAQEISHPGGRVLVFHVPSRPVGMPLGIGGAYWMRAGDDLRPMTPDELRRIILEAGPDFSVETCSGATNCRPRLPFRALPRTHEQIHRNAATHNDQSRPGRGWTINKKAIQDRERARDVNARYHRIAPGAVRTRRLGPLSPEANNTGNG